MREERANYTIPVDEALCIDVGEFRIPKQIAEITICGFLHIAVMDDQDFIRPTKEQIKNLHDMLCIDVVMFDEESED